MDLKEVYHSNKSSILGSEIEYIEKFQKQLIENYNLDRKVLNNNESTKHIDQKIINIFKYYSANSKSAIEFKKNNDQQISSITAKNGNDYLLQNINKEDISFNTLEDKKKLLIEKIKKYKDVFFDDYIVNLNSILLNSSFDLILRENAISKIDLLHPVNKQGSTIYSKNFFTTKKNSKLLIVEKFDNNVQSNLNLVNHYEVEAGSEVIHLVIQNNSENANLQFTTHLNCHASSAFKQFIFNTSQGSIRNHHYADLLGQNSDVSLQGVFFAAKNQIVDNKTLISHLSQNCTSNQTYKGILTGKAQGSYLSKTFVDQKAQKTEAYQLSKGILLSEDASYHSKPELRIFADDVKCSHGSTIGPFDKDMLFYLRTRGIDIGKAKSLLIKSFYSDLLSNIKEQEYISEINSLVDLWLNNNNF